MGSAPKPPDPVKTAAAQTQMNKDTAVTQQELNMVNQNTPYGSLSYEQTGTSASGTPQYTATQTLSPENQALYDNYMQLAKQFGQIGNTQASNVAGALGSPFNFDAAQANKLFDVQKTFLDPQWSQYESALDTKLINQGLQPGTEAYRRAKEEFSDNRQRAYDQNFLNSYQTMANQALTERNQPLNELSAFMSGSQVQQPGFANTPQTSVSGVDYAGLVNNNYNQQMANYQNKMGGIFGTIGTLGSLALSDRRLKHDIRKVGTLDNGLNVYAYKLMHSRPTQIGLMADEVADVNPDAVVDVNGIKMVNYDMAIL